MDDIREEMEEFIQDIVEELGLDYDKTLKFCFRTYELELDVETNQRAIRYRIENESKIKEDLWKQN